MMMRATAFAFVSLLVVACASEGPNPPSLNGGTIDVPRER